MTNVTDQAATGEGLAEQASAKVQDAAAVAQEKASELREQGSARLRDQFDQRSTDGGCAGALAGGGAAAQRQRSEQRGQ